MDSGYKRRWRTIATQVGGQRTSGNLPTWQGTGRKPGHGQDGSGEVDGGHLCLDGRLQSQLQPVPAAGGQSRRNDGTPDDSWSQVIKTLVCREGD